MAIALNDVPIDVLALQLGSNRNAIYKNLFDARRALRASLAADGHPLSEEEERMTDPHPSTSCFAPRTATRAATPASRSWTSTWRSSCGARIPASMFPGTAIHLGVCPGCRADHDGVLEAARRFGDVEPD